MTTLFIDRRGIAIEHDSGALIFREQASAGGCGARLATVPLAPLSRILLRGNAQLSASVLAALGERGIGLIVLSARLGTPCLFLARAHNDARLRVAQTEHSLRSSFCLDWARTLVAGKIAAQQRWLDTLASERPAQRYPLTHASGQLAEQHARAARADCLASLRGLEGTAAASYFAALRTVVPASLGFHERNRRPPRDPFNALLSLTYTLAHAEAVLALHSAGLDPAVGYYHQLSHARESLACDIVEPVRPLADALCLQLVATQTLTAEHFSTSASGCLLGKAGRTRYYGAYEERAQPLRNALRAQVSALTARLAPDLPAPAWATPDWSDADAPDTPDTPDTP